MQNDFDIRFVISVFLRRFPIFILTAVLIFGAAAGVAVVLPPVYKASATMLVISQQIPSELAQSTVTVGAVERIKVIEKQLMTRDTLLEIEDQFKIFPNRSSMSPSDVVEAMRRQTLFEQAVLGSSGRRGGAPGALAFTISFQAASPQVTARVTNELVTRILERNVQLRTSRAAGTSEFFQQQVSRLEAELTKLELDIVNFKAENGERLPETLAYRRQRLSLLEQTKQLRERERADLLDQESLLVENLGKQRSENKPEELMTPVEQQLAEVKRQRIMRRAILSENHPEIRAIDNRIKALEALVEADKKVAGPDGERAPRSPLETQMTQQLELIDKRLGSVNTELSDLNAEIEKLSKSIEETPNVEMALNTLQREYDGMRAEFQSARTKLSSATTGEELEVKQQAERFEVLEQATLPDSPISPNRPMILLAGAAGGLGAGLAMVLLLEMMNAGIRRPSELAKIDITPIAIIPYIYSQREQRRRSVVRTFTVIGVLVLIFGGAYVVHYHYMPLDLLLRNALEKAKITDAIQLVRSRLNF